MLDGISLFAFSLFCPARVRPQATPAFSAALFLLRVSGQAASKAMQSEEIISSLARFTDVGE
ncbi:hypothetical protein DKK75_05400 [Bifidobacterium asteroides]|uniref:Uncharacterized protein n=1 Tax=Bifidobacterium asteroides TaxID=1684 RepID=A0A318ME64_9BIFI|nr:hypothetical protein DKK75_05400 [Bifidobacterium asteroides]